MTAGALAAARAPVARRAAGAVALVQRLRGAAGAPPRVGARRRRRRRPHHRRAGRLHRRHARRAPSPTCPTSGRPAASWSPARCWAPSPTRALASGWTSLGPALVLRFVTGVAMAGAYPPAMKIMATWFREGRGLAIGILVGALTVGSATPHLVRGVTDLPWRDTLLVGLRPGAAGGGRRAGLRARGAARVPGRALRPPHGRRHLPRARRRAWPASATSATCGSSTRCGRGSACSWPKACARAAAATTRRQRQRRHVPGHRRSARSAAGPAASCPIAGAHDADDGRHGRQRRCARWRSASRSAVRRC